MGPLAARRSDLTASLSVLSAASREATSGIKSTNVVAAALGSFGSSSLKSIGDPKRPTAWLSRNALPVERCLQVLADVKADTSFDLATLSVAVREIRNLIDATSAAAAGGS